MIKRSYLFACIIFIFSGCVTRSYYLSPLYGTASSYHTMPLQQDSTRFGVYANGAFNIGGNNEDLRDNSFCFQGNLYGVHQAGVFKGWYGAGVSIGNYQVHKYDSSTINPDFDTAAVNTNAGNKFFGSANFNAGMNISIPVGRNAEWRVIGLSGTVQNEFGKYLQFRQNLDKVNAHVANLASGNLLATVAVSTEFAFETKRATFSFQTQLNYLLGDNYMYIDYRDDGEPFRRRYNYVSNTFALTKQRTTGFMQVNVGKRMANFEMGINYQLFPGKR